MPTRYLLPLLLLLLTISAVVSLKLGVQSFAWSTLWSAWQVSSEVHFVVMEYRLPRVVLALLVGAALAVSGVLVQGIIRNPLASPDILGVNHAASLASLLALLLLPALPLVWLPLIAFAGGCAALVMLHWLTGTASPLRLAVVGVALAACFASVTDYLLLSRPQDVNTALLWLTGSLWGRDWQMVLLALPLPVLLLMSLALCRDLDLLALGDERAATLGVSLHPFQRGVLLVGVALAALAVAVCGPISFISLVVPHLVRRLVGGRHARLLPFSALLGALVLLLADVLARTLSPPMELPAGVITALIGAPWFFWLLIRTR
ncbi:Fe(3+) dicitrate ABC transporter permease subunit FecD [Pantoea phytobeneficialis]|uniref:Iron-dicitrate transporter subunit FecD n=1 Tax=Pantoea phytobeneficialis TaxID=2052056 RepID=A0AAP9HAF2_9GAMM|nr:iron-dicitrate transporter subunit FecD [Pantoea phytobeneficialis]